MGKQKQWIYIVFSPPAQILPPERKEWKPTETFETWIDTVLSPPTQRSVHNEECVWSEPGLHGDLIRSRWGLKQ
eukprot:9419544-Alexandrium_andersonii.AAC.1